MSSAFHVDPMSLAPDERVDMLVRVRAHAAWVAARELRVIAAMAADWQQATPCPRLDREFYLEEVRAATGLSVMAAGERIELARDLTGRLTSTLAALESGAITLAHARHLSESLDGVEDDAAHEVEAAALAFAADRRDLASFRRKVRREVLRADTRQVEQQLADAITERRVWRSDQDHAMSELGVLLPAQQAVEVMTALDLRADQYGPHDPRTRDQRRADAQHELVLAGLHGCSGAPQPAVGPSVQVTVALSTLLGVDDEPGELDGYGPIPAVLARAIADDRNGTPPQAGGPPGDAWSPTGTGSCSTTAAPDTAHPRTCAATSPPATGPADFPAATVPRRRASRTTSSRGRRAAPPAQTTSSRSAHGITTPNTTPAGKHGAYPTDRSNGPAPPATTTPSNPAGTPST